MTRFGLHLGLALVLPLAALAPVSAASKDAAAASQATRFDAIRNQIRQQLAKDPSTPSIALAVAHKGKIVWEEGFGWADREKRIPATENTPYSLASISKPITTTGLMVLVRDGKIDLDRPVDDYLGAVKLNARIGNARDATVRRVADHTSGLPGHHQFFYVGEPAKRPSMDETLRRYGNLLTPPGEIHGYSNLGYGVLDYVIERVSGQSYTEFMRTQVFQPLGLKHTSIDIAPELQATAATRYDPTGKPLPFYDFDHPGASAVYSSAHDLVRFGMFHLKNHLRDQKPILSDALIDQMHRPTTPPNSDGKALPGYGIGFAVDRRGAYRVISHSGGMGGVSTQMLLFPDQDIAVVVLSNARVRMPFDVADDLVRVLLPDWTGKGEWRERTPPPPLVVPPELLGRWTGKIVTYTGEMPITLEFQPDNDVHAKVGDQLVTLVDNARFNNKRFYGDLAARIDTPDALLHPATAYMSLSLALRGNVLNGQASAQDLGEKGLPAEPRLRNSLGSWVELKKEP